MSSNHLRKRHNKPEGTTDGCAYACVDCSLFIYAVEIVDDYCEGFADSSKSGVYKEGTAEGTDPTVSSSSLSDGTEHNMQTALEAACRVVSDLAVGSFTSDTVQAESVQHGFITVLWIESASEDRSGVHPYVEIVLTHDTTTNEATMIAKNAVMHFNLDQVRVERNIKLGGTKAFVVNRTETARKLAKIINVDQHGKTKAGGKAEYPIRIRKIDLGRERG